MVTRITRDNPTALLFLLDRSTSMKHFMGKDSHVRKADSAAEAINKIITGFVLQSTKGGVVHNYFYIGVIGYDDIVAPVLGGALKGLDLVPIKDLADNPLRIEERVQIGKFDDGAGGLVERTAKYRFPIWVDAKADGRTAMCRALEYAYKIMAGWVVNHPACFPPIVINISDGEATDGDQDKPAKKIRELSTSAGNVMLFNFHISSKPKGELLFPAAQKNIPDRHARKLFGMSSLMTDDMISVAHGSGIAVTKESRGFGYCVSNSETLVKLLEIGSRTPKP